MPSLFWADGWGDISQAADPQLAVLEMGAGYGQWQWSIPPAQPPGPGLYGHGAALLPGNVMMVYGGYSISLPSDKPKMRPRQTGSGGHSPMFLNLTTLTWSDTYTNPASSGALSSGSNTSPSQPSNDRTIGLALGLGLGILLIIAVVALIIWVRRRQKRRQRNRDKAVRALAQDHGHFPESGRSRNAGA